MFECSGCHGQSFMVVLYEKQHTLDWQSESIFHFVTDESQNRVNSTWKAPRESRYLLQYRSDS